MCNDRAVISLVLVRWAGARSDSCPSAARGGVDGLDAGARARTPLSCNVPKWLQIAMRGGPPAFGNAGPWGALA
jgi:hypothetical protein